MASQHPIHPHNNDAGQVSSVERRTNNLLLYIVIAFSVVGTILRFWPRSDLWLDEALSLNIAQTGWDGIPEALRQDGHPPLYYYLLMLWSKIGGDGTWWVRALSGVLYSLTLPLFYIAGRRLSERTALQHGTDQFARHRGGGSETFNHHRGGLIAVAIASMAAYGVRFGSENRMYALVILLTTIGYLVFSRALWDEPQHAKFSWRSWKFIAVGGVITTALLWTHYWSMWLVGATGLLLILRWFRRPDARGNTVAGIAALILGGLLFIPWLPTLLYQTAHTGTPWGEPVGVVETMTTMISSFSGDQLTSYILIGLVLVALFIKVTTRASLSASPEHGTETPTEHDYVEAAASDSTAEAHTHVRSAADQPLLILSEKIQPRVLTESAILVLTMVIGWATSAVSGSTFQPRYGAVVFTFFIVIVAAGLNVLRTRLPVVIILGVFFVLSLYVNAVEIRLDRTQAGELAEQIALSFEEGDVVISCPDQVGVATQRALEQRGVVNTNIIPYPTAGDPHFVDWVDYKERNEAATPQGFWDSMANTVSTAPKIFFVRAGGYETFGNDCAVLGDVIGVGRERSLLAERGDAYESMDLWVYQLPG